MGHFAILSSSKLVVILLILGKSKLTEREDFKDFGQVTIILLRLGKTLGCKKQSKPPPLGKKFMIHT